MVLEDNKLKLSNELNALFDYAITKLIEDHPNVKVNIYYIALGMLEMHNCLAYNTINGIINSITFEAIEEGIYNMVHNNSMIAVRPNRGITFDNDIKILLNNAEKERNKLKDDAITSNHILLSMLNEENEYDVIRKVFNIATIDYNIVLAQVSNNTINDNVENITDIDSVDENPSTAIMDIKYAANPTLQRTIVRFKVDENGNIEDMDVNTNNESTNPLFNYLMEWRNKIENEPKEEKRHIKKSNKGKTTYINAFCTDLNELAEKGKIDKIVGRENEINQIIKVLARRKKNNALLIGEAGCGKTAIIMGLASKICEENVPNLLLNKKIVSLDMTSLIAGTQLRGMFEDRMKNLIDELKANNNYILFIDDIHDVISDKKRNDVDLSSILNKVLEDGDIQIIGTTTFKEYRNAFDMNANLGRKFQKVEILSPTLEDSINILKSIKPYYENFHKVNYTDSAIESCVKLASRYITDRNLPDSAIDIMDEAGAAGKLSVVEPDQIATIKKKISENRKEKKKALNNDDFKVLDELVKIHDKLTIELKKLEEDFEKAKSEITVDSDNIALIVSEKTGIPLNKLNSSEKKELLNIDKVLKEYIVGQDEAIEKVCKAIKRSRIGLSNPNKPSSFMFIGNSGCGKTLLAKKLAKEIYGDEKYLVRFDMSEYADKTSVNKLIGSAAGYIGYDNGGLLTEAIKNKKHCVLLLDEIEKSNSDVFNIFLQVLDEGQLTDNAGLKVDFKNVIILFTSNVGTKEIGRNGNGMGFSRDANDVTKETLTKELKKTFPPEFINRLDDVVYFNKLTDNNLKSIINIELNNLKKSVENIGYNISFDDTTIETIFKKIENKDEFGARPILRIIQDDYEGKITDLLLEHDYEKGYNFDLNSI